jgi:hypothetical protein
MGSGTTYENSSGAGGGRILPGTGGAASRSESGAGGSANQPGEDFNSQGGAGGGGGWGAEGGDGGYLDSSSVFTLSTGGTGGNAVVTNGFSVTWQGEFATDFSNHIYGAVS